MIDTFTLPATESGEFPGALPEPEPVTPEPAPAPPAPRQPPAFESITGAPQFGSFTDEDKSVAVEGWRQMVVDYGKATVPGWSPDHEAQVSQFANEFQSKLAAETKFAPEDKPFRHFANQVVFDPNRPADGLNQAWRAGLIEKPSKEDYKARLDLQQKIQERKVLQEAAGVGSAAKAFGLGAGRGAAFTGGAIGTAALLAPAGPETFGIVPFLGGLAGGITASAAYDTIVDKLAENSDAIKSLTASSGLHTNYDAAGEITSFVATGLVGAYKGVRRFALVAENLGKEEALKQAAKYVAVSGGVGAVSAPVIAAIDRFKNTAFQLGHEKEAPLFDPGSIAANTVLAIMLGNLGVKFTKFSAGEAAGIFQRGMAGEKLSAAEQEMFGVISRKMAQKPNDFVFEAEQATMGGQPLGGATAARMRPNPAQARQAPPAGAAAPSGATPPPRMGPPPQQQAGAATGAPPKPRVFSTQDEFNAFMDGAKMRGDSEAGHEAWQVNNKDWFSKYFVNAANNKDVDAQNFINSVVTKRSNAAHAARFTSQPSGGSGGNGKGQPQPASAAPQPEATGARRADSGNGSNVPAGGRGVPEPVSASRPGGITVPRDEGIRPNGSRAVAPQIPPALEDYLVPATKAAADEAGARPAGLLGAPPLSPHPAQTATEHIVSTAVQSAGALFFGGAWNAPHASILKANAADIDPDYQEGFIVQKADGSQEFVGRGQAMEVAKAAGQVSAEYEKARNLQSQGLQTSDEAQPAPAEPLAAEVQPREEPAAKESAAPAPVDAAQRGGVAPAAAEAGKPEAIAATEFDKRLAEDRAARERDLRSRPAAQQPFKMWAEVEASKQGIGWQELSFEERKGFRAQWDNARAAAVKKREPIYAAPELTNEPIPKGYVQDGDFYVPKGKSKAAAPDITAAKPSPAQVEPAKQVEPSAADERTAGKNAAPAPGQSRMATPEQETRIAQIASRVSNNTIARDAAEAEARRMVETANASGKEIDWKRVARGAGSAAGKAEAAAPEPINEELAGAAEPSRTLGEEEAAAIAAVNLTGPERSIIEAVKGGQFDSVSEAARSIGMTENAAAKAFASALKKIEDDLKPKVNGFRPRYRTGEEAFISGDILNELVAFGKLIFEKGMDFARWAAEMIKRLGEAAARLLAQAWESISGAKIKPEFRESGALFGSGRRKQPDALPGISRVLTTRAFWEGSADVFLKKPTFAFLGKAINRQVDLADKRLGDTIGKLEVWESRTAGKDQAAAKETLSQFIDARESGRVADAATILAQAPPAAADLIKTIGDIAEYTGHVSTKLVQPNGRVGADVNDGGTIRPLRNLGREFWPRMLKPEFEVVLRDPLSDATLWNQMKQDLLANGNIQNLADADNFIKGASKDESESDFLASLFKGRHGRLPAHWMDTSLEGFENWATSWSDIVSKIEAFGQKIRPGDKDQFDVALEATTHQPTQSFINSVRDRAFNRRNVGPAAKYLMDAPRLLASGLFLTNPVTIGINLTSSKIMNLFTYGLKSNVMRNPLAVFSKQNHLDAYQLGILKRDMVRLLYRDDLPGLDTLKNFTNAAMKFSGYSAVENLTRVDSYLTALSFLHSGLAAVRKNPTSNASFQFMAFIKRNGYNIGDLIRENGTGDATDTFLRSTIRDTQGGYAYNQVPWWTDTPMGRFLLQFSKFSTMFTRNVARNVIKPAFVGTNVTINAGGKKITKRVFNIKPLLYFIAGSALGGEAIAYLKNKAFGVERRDATLDELAAQMDENTRDGLVAIGWRVLNDIMTMGMLGIFNTPIQVTKDATDRTKFRNPLAPPGIAFFTNFANLIQSRWEQGPFTTNGLASDVGDFAKSSVSMYRYGEAFVKEQALNAKLDWEDASIKALEDDVRFIRGVTSRYANDVGLASQSRTSLGRTSKTPTTPMKQDLKDALMLGNEATARKVLTEYLDEFPSLAEKNKRLRALSESVTQNQPIKVGGIASNARSVEFIAWAKGKLSASDLQRIKDVDERYRNTATKVGLMMQLTPSDQRKLVNKLAKEEAAMKRVATPDETSRFMDRSLRERRPGAGGLVHPRLAH